uniref:Uncharacterized protein n=1 Tax=Panagrolaimus davidi TaxID=227884 RepID=A0A914QQC8_9BILA
MSDDGIVPVLIELLNYKSNADEQDMFYILLGILLDLQPLIFDECIKLGLHEKLCTICEKTTFSWPLASLINVCYPNQELLYCVKRYIFSLEECPSFNDDEMLEGISHTLVYLCEFEKPIQKMVIDSGILKKLVPFIDAVKRKRFSKAILFTFQYISENEEFGNSLFETGILKFVEKLLMSSEACADNEIIEPIATLIYNLGSNPENIEKIIEANLIYYVIDFAEWSSVKEDFVMVLINLLTNCNSKQAKKIIKMNALSTLFNCLQKVEDLNIKEDILETFFNVLQKSENVKNVFDEMEEYGIFDKIKTLKNHENQKIREAAAKIAEKFL